MLIIYLDVQIREYFEIKVSNSGVFAVLKIGPNNMPLNRVEYSAHSI